MNLVLESILLVSENDTLRINCAYQLFENYARIDVTSSEDEALELIWHEKFTALFVDSKFPFDSGLAKEAGYSQIPTYVLVDVREELFADDLVNSFNANGYFLIDEKNGGRFASLSDLHSLLYTRFDPEKKIFF